MQTVRVQRGSMVSVLGVQKTSKPFVYKASKVYFAYVSHVKFTRRYRDGMFVGVCVFVRMYVFTCE